MEEDQLVRSSVANLVSLSRFQLSGVVRELLSALEVLIRSAQQAGEDKVTVELLQSQLFLLKVLVAALIHHWKFTSNQNSNLTDPNTLYPQESEPSLGSRAEALPKGWSDPPPMDDTQAKHVLSVMTIFIKQTVGREEAAQAAANDALEGRGGKGDSSNHFSSRGAGDRSRDYDQRDQTSSFGSAKGYNLGSSRSRNDSETKGNDAQQAERFPEIFTPSSLALANGSSLFILYPAFPPTRTPFEVSDSHIRRSSATGRELPRFNSDSWQSAMSLNRDNETLENVNHLHTSIFRLASQVVFYLSASNWVVVYARFRNRLTYLSTTIEESPNTAELRLLECSNLQRNRLANVIQELCSSFLLLKRSAQYTTALVLRRAVWSWIQYHPSEFCSLAVSNRRLEGGPDVLFDQVLSLSESTRKKNAFWPMMTALLILCPDIIGKAAVGEGRKSSSSLSKKFSFLDTIRKSPRHAKLGDVATLCCVDICKAAAYTPRSDSGLRLLVPDIEGELREKLFDPSRPLINQNKQVEVSLMIDFFVAAFRLDPQKTMRDLVPVCMADSSPAAFKVALVKACVLLASERNRLPWSPDVSLLYPQIGRVLRNTFKDMVYRLPRMALSDIVQNEKRGGNKSSSAFAKTGKAVDENSGRYELLQAILQLWTYDIKAVAFGLSFEHSTSLASLTGKVVPIDREKTMRAALQVDSILSLMYMIGMIMDTPAQFTRIRMGASTVLAPLFEKEAPDEHVSSFIDHAQRALCSLAPHLMQVLSEKLIYNDSNEHHRHYLNHLRSAFSRHTLLISAQDTRGIDLQQTPSFPSRAERLAGATTVEAALLMTICSCDTDVCSAAMQTARDHATLQNKYPSYFAPVSAEWNKFFLDLSDPSFVQTGRIAQQKRVGSLLRDIQTPSPASWIAWKLAYRRWTSLTQVVARPIAEESGESVQEKAAQWHNFAGFLCAFGGACVDAEDSMMGAQASEVLQVLPHFSDEEAPGPLIERFLQEMVDLLVSDSLWVREKTKETLGIDLGMRLNDILFRQIHAVLSDFFDKDTGYPRTAEMYTIFVEQSIGVISSVLGRMSERAEWSSSVDIGSLMVLYAEYANSLGKNEQALRIKTAMCQMCEALMRKKSYFTFSNELRVRNRLFQALTTWTSDPSEEVSLPEKLDRLQRDLDVSCLKCISIFLDRLPLLLADDALLLDDKVEWAKTRQFALYFNYFIKILNRTRTSEAAAMDRAKSKGFTDARALPGKAKDPNRDLGPLRDSAILALSNLLASNIDSGLHTSLPLAYHEDPRIRTAFMQIMTNVLNQGTAFDELERLGASQQQSKVVDLVVEGDMQLALSICQVCRGWDVENLDTVLLSMFDSRGGIIKFLKAALEEEIMRTTSEEMVFRSNSFRTHLLSVFAKTHGYEYLRSIMAPLITEMAEKPRGYSFEIDPSRLEPGESAHKNQARLEEMAQAFIDAICSSAHRVPAVLRELCRYIRNLMDARFPSSRYQGVGGLIFLRFISPAVVAPQIIDINLTGPGKELRRGLLLISKILVTLASNNLFPSHKEPYLTSLNDFLKSNVWKVTAFLDQVSDARTDPDRLYAADQPLGYGIHPYSYGINKNDQVVLHKFLFDNVDKIGKDLLSRHGSKHDANESGMLVSSSGEVPTGKKTYDKLCDVLAEVGEPKVDDIPEIVFGSGNLQDFLRRNGGRNLNEDSYKAVFHEGPPSKSGRTVLYYTVRNQNAETMDFEGMILHVLQILDDYGHRPFDMLIDLTACSVEHMAPQQWLTYFGSLVPSSVLNSLCAVYVVNCNTPGKEFMTSWAPATAPPESATRMEAFSGMTSFQGIYHVFSLPELEKHIDRRNIALEPMTLSIMTSVPELQFDQITMVWYYRSLTPVTFRIGGDYLQITSLKPTDLVPGVSAFINDVFHLSDVDDVRAISIRGDDNTFFLTCRGGTISFLFNSRDRTEIVQALRQAKARVSRSRATKAVDRMLRPSDVPGTLLNMAMLNMTSEDYHLRLGAYNLLCALSTSFNFGASSARKRLLSSKGLALPANTMAFISELSRDFAAAAPGVTLEFLLSFFDGFERATASQRTMCLHYMSPWLSNLVMFTHTSREQQGEYQKRIKEILNQLISITTKQPDMYAIMQRCVWSQISKLDDLIPCFLEVFSEAAMDSGLHTPRFEAILDTMVSFASINLRGKLLSRLRRVIAKTAQNPTVAQLHENAAWKEIATLVRMNMILSFTNRVEALLYLPELLHIILLLAGSGVDATRFSIHGTAVNLMHSLCTEDPRESKKPDEAIGRTPEGAAKLRALLERFSEPEFTRLFGLPDGPVSAFNASTEIVRETPDNAAIERLASVMYEIADMASPSVDAANSWRARLTSLVTSTAFQYNPIIQSRAFVLLGCLAQGEIDDDLLYQILVSLRGSISEWANVSNDAPMISIVTCLGKVVKILPTKSRYLPQMFWLGISMVQYGHIPLFKAGVELVHATVTSIWERKIPMQERSDLVSYLLDARFEFRDAACKLDDETGVDFEINFSFGMAALLVKGLRHPSTKECTIELMRIMLRLCAVDGEGEVRSRDGRISTSQLGFFIGLLPTATRPEDFGALLRLAGFANAQCDAAVAARRRNQTSLFEYLDVLENKIALLVVTLVASLLQHAESDAEKLLLYEFLEESAREVPAIVSILYDSLAPGIREIFVNSQNGAILDAVHGIAQTAVSEPVFAAQAHETVKRGGPGAYLEESGYASLLECGAFTPLKEGRRLVLAKLSTQLLAGLIDVGTT